MINPLPELQHEFAAPSPEEEAEHVAAIERFLNQHHSNPPAGQPQPVDAVAPDSGVEDAEVVSEPTPVIEEPKIPKVVQLGLTSPFTPPGIIFMGVGQNVAEKGYRSWLKRSYKEAFAQSAKERPSKPSKAYQNAMLFIHTLILVLKGQQQHEAFQLIYTGPSFPRQLKIEPMILELANENRDILLALAPYFGLGSAPAITAQTMVDTAGKSVEVLPEPEILDAAPNTLFALHA